MKTYIHFIYLAHFFLEREMFQMKDAETIKTHILCSVNFYKKNSAFGRYCGKIL